METKEKQDMIEALFGHVKIQNTLVGSWCAAVDNIKLRFNDGVVSTASGFGNTPEIAVDKLWHTLTQETVRVIQRIQDGPYAMQLAWTFSDGLFRLEHSSCQAGISWDL